MEYGGNSQSTSLLLAEVHYCSFVTTTLTTTTTATKVIGGCGLENDRVVLTNSSHYQSLEKKNEGYPFTVSTNNKGKQIK